jgi:hypothetical protein
MVDGMYKIKEKLMSKNGTVVTRLAKEMMMYNSGDRLKTIGQYSEDFNTGRGTIQAALKFMQEAQVIHLNSRGHLGTYINWLDYKKLWEISDFGVVMGVMPLPYSKRYEGLATGLYQVFEEADIPFSLAFMRGAAKRFEALNTGKYNFGIVSQMAALQESDKYSNIEILHQFNKGSYVGEHVIIFRESRETQIRDGMRVAIDPSSIDQVLLTSNECKGKEVVFIETSYAQILKKMAKDEIDAAIWSGDEIREKSLDFTVAPLVNTKEGQDTVAVFMVEKSNPGLNKVLKKFIDMTEIEKIQLEVMKDITIPKY